MVHNKFSNWIYIICINKHQHIIINLFASSVFPLYPSVYEWWYRVNTQQSFVRLVFRFRYFFCNVGICFPQETSHSEFIQSKDKRTCICALNHTHTHTLAYTRQSFHNILSSKWLPGWLPHSPWRCLDGWIFPAGVLYHYLSAKI